MAFQKKYSAPFSLSKTQSQFHGNGWFHGTVLSRCWLRQRLEARQAEAVDDQAALVPVRQPGVHACSSRLTRRSTLPIYKQKLVQRKEQSDRTASGKRALRVDSDDDGSDEDEDVDLEEPPPAFDDDPDVER